MQRLCLFCLFVYCICAQCDQQGRQAAGQHGNAFTVRGTNAKNSPCRLTYTRGGLCSYIAGIVAVSTVCTAATHLLCGWRPGRGWGEPVGGMNGKSQRLIILSLVLLQVSTVHLYFLGGFSAFFINIRTAAPP